MTTLITESSSTNGIASAYNEHATAHEILRQHYIGRKIPKVAADNMEFHHTQMMKHAGDLHKALGKAKATEELSDQAGRAQSAAEQVLEHRKLLGHKGDITHVQHTGASGISAYGDTKQTNPSDIVLHHKNGKHLGVSLKSSKDGQIGFHNGGFKSVASAAGASKLGEDADDHRTSELAKHFPGDAQGIAHAKIKALRKKVAAGTATKSEVKKHEDVQASSSAVLSSASDKLAAHYNKLAKDDHEGLKKHIQSTFLKHNPTNNLDHIKATGFGTNGKYMAHSEHPDDNEMNKAVHSATKFSFHRSGDGYTHVVAHQPDGSKKHVFSMQTKFNEEKLGSSLKSIGQPSTKKFGSLPDYKG